MRLTRRSFSFAVASAAAGLVFPRGSFAETAAFSKENVARRAQIANKGMTYLRTKGQSADGSFSPQAGIGVTALVATALLRNDVPANNPALAKSLALLEKNIQPDGGIYKAKSNFKNYETCLVLMCFREANRTGQYTQAIANAQKFIRGGQIGGKKEVESGDAAYGGVGYGNDGRPDLSNTAFFIEALRSTGAAADDQAIQAALAFVSRCQNLETEHNNTRHAAKNPDGGFYYTPTGDGSSPAGKTENGGLRSYGAMSYAGLKSMIYAGLTADDPRVKAALEWASKNYSLSENPGLGTAGLYYYQNLFATAMQASGLDTLEDKSGKKHDWRVELIDELGKQQRPDGAWTNANSKWLEGDPNLVTGYALLSLACCKPPTAGAKKAK